MSNYPDNFSSAAFNAAYAEDDRPTWDDVSEIARRHLEPAFKAMAVELDKLANIVDCRALTPDDLKNLIDWTISDSITDALRDDFVSALNEGA